MAEPVRLIPPAARPAAPEPVRRRPALYADHLAPRPIGRPHHPWLRRAWDGACLLVLLAFAAAALVSGW